MFRIVEDFLTDAASADTDAELCDAFANAVGTLGFSRFGTWAAGSTLQAVEDGFLLQRYPDGWTAYYKEQGFWNIDPLHRIGLEEATPFLWKDPRIVRRFSDEEKAFMLMAADEGVGGGLFIPVRSSFSPLGQVSILGGELDVDPGANIKLHNLAVYFYDIARRSAARRADIPERTVDTLTACERECLLWLSAGKSDWEIGAILTVSELEVKRHIARVMYKFGVPTRTQAVVQAVMSEQIVP